jgi:hypothetical protein
MEISKLNLFTHRGQNVKKSLSSTLGSRLCVGNGGSSVGGRPSKGSGAGDLDVGRAQAGGSTNSGEQGVDGATVRLRRSVARAKRVRRARELEVRAGLHKGAASAFIERGRGEGAGEGEGNGRSISKPLIASITSINGEREWGRGEEASAVWLRGNGRRSGSVVMVGGADGGLGTGVARSVGQRGAVGAQRALSPSGGAAGEGRRKGRGALTSGTRAP